MSSGVGGIDTVDLQRAAREVVRTDAGQKLLAPRVTIDWSPGAILNTPSAIPAHNPLVFDVREAEDLRFTLCFGCRSLAVYAQQRSIPEPKVWARRIQAGQPHRQRRATRCPKRWPTSEDLAGHDRRLDDALP